MPPGTRRQCQRMERTAAGQRPPREVELDRAKRHRTPTACSACRKRSPRSPGNYIFCKWNADGTAWISIYIGESGNLYNRLKAGARHQTSCINREGATHLHAHCNDGGELTRRAGKSRLARAVLLRL